MRLLFILLFLFSVIPTSNAVTWVLDADVISGLTDVGDHSTPTVFQKDNVWTLIVGNSNGFFKGYTWDGDSWVLDAGLVLGLTDDGSFVYPTVFQKDGTWTLIRGNLTGLFKGYTWDGDSWVFDAGVVSGLTDVGDYSTPTVFQKDGTWTLITGNLIGLFAGYTWDGDSWVLDADVISGLTDVGSHSTPTVFQKDGTWTLITGEYYGLFTGFTGYTWDGDSWVLDADVISGLTYVGSLTYPTVFQKDNVWTLIVGNETGLFTGFANILTTNTATEITDTSVKVSMTISGTTPNRECWIAYSGRDGFYPYSTEHTTYTTNGIKYITISGYPLIAGHKFYYRGECTSIVGNQQNFTLTAAAQITEYDFDKNWEELISADLNISKLVIVAPKPYTDIFGTMFWGIMFSIIFIVGFIRQGETINMSILGILLAAGIMTLVPPEFQNIGQALLIVSLTGMIYSIIFKK